MSAAETLITEHLDTWTSAIKAKSSAGRGGGKKSEFYGIKKLRELILELAVRGLIVPQDSSDESAAKLLTKIAIEKAKLIKGGKMKKGKKIPLPEEELPFDIPNNWAWTQLVEISEIGPRNTLPDDLNVGFVPMPLISTSYDGTHGQEIKTWSEIKKGYTHFANGDIAIAKITPCFENSKAAIFGDLENGHGAGTTELHVARLIGEFVNSRFLLLYLKAPMFLEKGKPKMTGSAGQKRIPASYFAGNPLPLPPLAEQHRIVAKVDELMALCDQLEQQQEDSVRTHGALVETLLGALTAASERGAFAESWQRIASHFDTLFTTESSIDQLKQTILQLAVMGKLVPRIVNEGTGRDVLRGVKDPEIEVSDGPTLPDHWAWVLLGSATKLMNSGWSPACKAEPADGASWGVLKTTAVQTLEYQEHQNKALPQALKSRPENEVFDGDILFTRAGPMNRVGILCVARPTRPKLMLSDKIIRFHLIPEIDPDFAALSMSAGYSSRYIEQLKSGMAASQVNISQPKLRSVPIPIPPLAEQHRIVTKVEELMALCDRLKLRLQSAQTTQLHLADTLVDAAIH